MTDTPPPEEQTKIKYTKKARHGHGQDVTDIHNIRQVAGCLPIDPNSKRFLLISSSKHPDAWVIPKGGWEVDETQEHAALRETWEEAGIKGRITRQIGVFVERSKKKIKAHHWIFEMEIDEVAKKYPERNKRDRRWFTYDEALIATQNNNYIQEAIRLSTLNPSTKGIDVPSTPSSAPIIKPMDSPSKEANVTPPSNTESIKPKDSFQELQELMENASISK